jgi:hypothetical protein
MQPPEQAEAHLRAIRALMERATIYQTISAPSALIGGALSVGLDLAITSQGKVSGTPVTLLWLAVCAIVCALNFAFLYRDAARRGEPFYSIGMKVALRAVAPSFLLGLLATTILHELTWMLYPIWCVTYGVGLLAASHFAPYSIRILGRAFWLAGVSYVVLMRNWPVEFIEVHFMGLTFGLFHLAYAAWVWPRHTTLPSVIEFPEADA